MSATPSPLRARSETPAHALLKRLAVAWAQEQGFAQAGVEVAVPRSGFRADVAAAVPGGRTAVFECKQARADLLKDAHREAATRARLAELLERRRTLESLLAVHRPGCGAAKRSGRNTTRGISRGWSTRRTIACSKNSRP